MEGALSEVKEGGAWRDVAFRKAGITDSEKAAELGPCSGRILHNQSKCGLEPWARSHTAD